MPKFKLLYEVETDRLPLYFYWLLIALALILESLINKLTTHFSNVLYTQLATMAVGLAITLFILMKKRYWAKSLNDLQEKGRFFFIDSLPYHFQYRTELGFDEKLVFVLVNDWEYKRKLYLKEKDIGKVSYYA